MSVSSIVIPGNGLKPPGGKLVPTSGQRIRPEDGVSLAVVHGGLELRPEVTNVEVAPGVRFEAGPEFDIIGFNASSVIQWGSPSAAFYGEVSCMGKPINAIQLNRYDDSSPWPSGLVEGALVENNSLSPGDTVGKNHLFYLRDAHNFRVTNTRTRNCRGGGDYHFYNGGGTHQCVGNRVTNVQSENPYIFLFFWQPNVSNNIVEKALVLNQNGKLCITRNDLPTDNGNTVDYVTTPTPGYGLVVAPNLDCQKYADAASEELIQTTISYQDWAKNVITGKYNPKDGSETHWGKAFANLKKCSN